jgi:peptidoglycan/xylan/chitin deacetylase (PgdA/CDA1 family)
VQIRKERVIRKRIGIFVAACFFYSGLVRLARWWRQRSGPHLIILTYHRASGGDLRRHLLYLRRHYRMLHLEEALEELYASPGEMKQGRDRRTPLVLTFDDGYHDNYTHAFTLARELHIPITIFLIPGYTESGAPFWWLQAKHLVQHAQVDKVLIEGRLYDLAKAAGRTLLAQTIDDRLRHAGAVALRETFLAHVRELLAGSSSVPAEGEAVRPLTWGQVREMDASGWVSFGGHTMHHPILAYLSSPDEVRREVEECRYVLEQRLGHRVRTFAYPLGRPEHIGDVAPQAVHEAGYAWAVTTIQGINTPRSDPHQLRRLSGLVSRHWLVMAAETSGVWRFFSPLWKWRDSPPGAKES